MTNLHSSNDKIMLERSYDRKVFGVWRAVTEIKHKVWRIMEGEVQIKFRGKWWDIEELDEKRTNAVLQIKKDNGYRAAVTGVVRITDWSQHN